MKPFENNLSQESEQSELLVTTSTQGEGDSPEAPVQNGSTTISPGESAWASDSIAVSPGRPFPTESLPPVVREMVKSVSKVHRCPTSITAACAIGTLSGSIGKGLKVLSLPGLTTPSNLFILIGATSGSGKSLAFKEITKPLLNYSQTLEQMNFKILEKEEAIQNLQNALEHMQGEKAKQQGTHDGKQELESKLAEALLSLATLQGSRDLKLTCEDITPAALACLLAQGDECVASISGDARDIVYRVSRSRARNQGTAEGILLKAYSEDPIQIHRLGKESIRLKEPNLTCLWLVQPDMVQILFDSETLTEGGLMPRFLVHSVDASPLYIERETQQLNSEVVSDWEMLVLNLVRCYRLGKERQTVQPTSEAVKLMDTHYNRRVDERKATLVDIDPFVARWNEQAWRIALVLHAAEHGEDARQVFLSAETARSAIRVAEWFENEQLAVLEGVRARGYADAKSKVLELAKNSVDGISARDIQRARVRHGSEEVKALLARMVEEGILTSSVRKLKNGGKDAIVYRLE